MGILNDFNKRVAKKANGAFYDDSPPDDSLPDGSGRGLNQPDYYCAGCDAEMYGGNSSRKGPTAYKLGDLPTGGPFCSEACAKTYANRSGVKEKISAFELWEQV